MSSLRSVFPFNFQMQLNLYSSVVHNSNIVTPDENSSTMKLQYISICVFSTVK